MNRWHQLSTLRRYQIFFLVTAILPMLVFLAVFLGTTSSKWGQQDQQLLRAGLLYLQDIQSNRQMSSAQKAHLSLILPRYKLRTVNPSKAPSRLNGNDSDIFEEQLDKKPYWTGFVRQPHTSDLLALSIPQGGYDAFSHENLVLFGLFLAILLIFIIGIGIWFENDLIKPLNVLAEAAGQVAKGNLKDRIPVEASLNTEARQTIEHFNRMLDKLEKHEKLRSTFISTLSHDLKTPLMAQKRALELLEEDFHGANLPHLERMVHALNTNNASQLRMVTKLLDIFRFEEGEFPLRFESVSLVEAVNDCLAELHPLASEHQISIHNQLSMDFPVIEGDYGQIKRIFTNLLSNAIQNIPNGSEVWITGALQARCVQIEVKDNGPGMEADILPYVFDPYFTLHRTRKKINSGLGLSICRMIVEAHHGHIGVSSQPGEGTCFYINLPVSQDAWNEKGKTDL